MPEENNMLIIEETDEGTVNITLLNLAAEESDRIGIIRDLIKDDPSTVVVLLIPEHQADPNIFAEGVKAGAKAYIKKPISGEEINRRLTKLL